MPERPQGRVGRRRLQQWFGLVAAVVGVIAAIALLAGIVAIVRLGDAREAVVERLDPATVAGLQLSQALLDQETAVRGFALTAEESALEPYRSGLAMEARAARDLRALGTRDDLAAVETRAAAWRRGFAMPAIARTRSGGPNSIPPRLAARGKLSFDSLRRALGDQQRTIAVARADARDQLRSNARFLAGSFIFIAVLLLLAGILVAVALSRIVVRPVLDLGSTVRSVAHGDFDERIEGSGPRDIVALGEDIETMRERIVGTLADLERSNAELEQFAYVASHDLQEPLRKVASFCQLLEKRYGGQLDERGEQYIYFAVDGAKRMQGLINDLLAFSRVGRLGGDFAPVDLDEVLKRALANLDVAIQEAGGIVEADALPTVYGEATLLGVVIQNLIGNGIKFRADEAPHVWLTVARDSGQWFFTCSDNGIGIEPEYAERVFVIFQRLHPKDEYAGTGIGLAMCRKIVEYHGGRIWLDTETTSGTTFHFTLPAIEESA